jgi:hypothetical protein
MPRKRSFTSNPPIASTSTNTLLEEPSFDDASMDMSYADDMGYASASAGGGLGGGGGGSPVEGSMSGDGGEDQPMSLGLSSGANGAGVAGMGSGMNVLGKPMGTNNFVTKLYQ